MTERTREIGLRMAIGACRIHVLLQFLAEAVFLSVSGGIAGILAGVAFSISLPPLTGWPARLSISAIAGGFLFSAAVGILRVLSGPQGGPSQPDRGAALRMKRNARVQLIELFAALCQQWGMTTLCIHRFQAQAIPWLL